MTGDSSDNIKGIPGIGEKTASRLLKEYGSLENIIAAAGELTGRTGEQVKKYKEQAELSKKLVTIQREIPLEIDLDSCAWEGPDYKELLEIFKKLEFKSLIKSIYQDNRGAEEEGKGQAGRNRGRKTAKEALAGADLFHHRLPAPGYSSPAETVHQSRAEIRSGCPGSRARPRPGKDLGRRLRPEAQGLLP